MKINKLIKRKKKRKLKTNKNREPTVKGRKPGLKSMIWSRRKK